MRFSACRKAMLRSPSSTPALTSSPRTAGRQCMTRACGGALASSASLTWKAAKCRRRSSRWASCPMLVHTSV
jgi:hypothetical protein